MSRMDDAAIREAMQSDGLPPESGGTILRLAVEALARGEEIAALERSEQRLAACVSNGDGNIRRLEREAEGLRAEVERLTKTLADQRCAYKSRAEAAEAEVARLKAEQAAAVCAWEEYARWPDLPSVPIGRVRLPDGREEEIALRPEQITGILRGIEKHVRQCLPYGVEAVKAWQDISDERALREAAEAEVVRLRAAALPEDAEEIVFKELSIGVFEPQDLEIQEAIHAKRRAKARAVVKALRRDA